jgi:colicin V production protein
MTLSGFFLIRGLLRGTLAQVFAFAGLVLGVLVGSAVADWVGTHWQSARPEIVFMLLRWLVAILSGLGVAAVMHAWGDLLAKAAHDGPFGWLDRVIGAALGLAVGLVCSVAVLVLLLQAPGLEFARPLAARGVTTGPLIAAGDLASTWSKSLPGGLWLHEQLRSAARRLAGRRQA